jgi:hypothetical protein
VGNGAPHDDRSYGNDGNGLPVKRLNFV